VQLRQDNKSGTLFNIVGFQTKIRYGEQASIFRKIPGLENAVFARMGGIHRNTFINSPRLLDGKLRLINHKRVRFAGQITGVEGYVESAAIGLLAGLFTSFDRENIDIDCHKIERNTAIGSLLQHITENADSDTFQPMNINYGLFGSAEHIGKKNRKEHRLQLSDQGIQDWKNYYKI